MVFMFKNLPPRLKIKIRLAEQLERDADVAPSIDREYELLAQADALRAEVAEFELLQRAFA